MIQDNLSDWFDSLKTAWVTKDIAAVKGLLSASFVYFEDPNNEPLTTWEQVESSWQEVNHQNDIQLQIDPLVFKDNEGTARYYLRYSDVEGEAHESRGAYYVKLDTSGKAVEFRQWWVPVE